MYLDVNGYTTKAVQFLHALARLSPGVLELIGVLLVLLLHERVEDVGNGAGADDGLPALGPFGESADLHR